MPYTSCDTVPDISVNERAPQNALIEICVWEAFIVTRTVSYARFLADHSLDGAQLLRENLPQVRACYRYDQHVWAELVKPYLIRHSIPVSIRIISAHQNAMNFNQ